MEKIPERKSGKPEQNKLPQEHIQPSKDFDTISAPRRDMIMPREFNSVSDPKISSQTHSQNTVVLYFD